MKKLYDNSLSSFSAGLERSIRLTDYSRLVYCKDLLRRFSTKRCVVKRCGFEEFGHWKLKDKQEGLKHKTGKFFSVEGIKVITSCPYVRQTWSQPIIVQPEVGFLGFVTKIINGTLFFLIQAKIEPGNIGAAQFSPTLQATRSNYKRAHHGATPNYLSLFLDLSACTVLVDQLQVEQGGRFLQKQNRNIVILTNTNLEAKDGFEWVTLGELDELIRCDNTLNMSTRSVLGNFKLSCIYSRNIFSCMETKISAVKSMSFFASHKGYDLQIRKVPLDRMDGWELSEKSIRRFDSKFFEVIALNISIQGREVSSWVQPMIRPLGLGICGLLLRNGEKGIEVLMQGKFECGIEGGFILGPTVQHLIGGYFQRTTDIPFFSELTSVDGVVLHDTMQSEEGGRFYEESNRNILKLVDDDFNSPLPQNYIWLTIEELSIISQGKGKINIQALCLIAAIPWKIIGYE